MDITRLSEACGAKAIVSEPAACAPYAVDGLVPKAVVFPATLAQTGEVLKLANREGWAVAPLGGGTFRGAGGRLARLDLVVATRRLDKVLDLDVANLTVTAQAGVRFDDLQDLLAGGENRCFIPLDPPLAGRATLGGVVAGGLTGPQRLRHGLPRDLVLGVRFLAPTGEIIGMGGKTVKNVSGYDAGKLMIGSLGCLGIVGEVTLRLLPLPEKSGALCFGFSGREAAAAFAREVVASRLLPTALEVMNPAALARGFDPAPGAGWAVAAGQAGFAEDLAREAADLRALARRHGAAWGVALDAVGARDFWRAYADRALAGGAVRLRASFPLAAAGSFLAAAAAAAAAADPGLGLLISASAGCGAGLVHAPGDGDPARLAAAAAGLRREVEALEGSLWLQCAPPGLKERLDPYGTPRPEWTLAARIKRALDPAGIMCPGRLVGDI